MGTTQDPGAVFNMLWAGNNQLFSEIAAQFPDGAATAFTVGVGLAMLAAQCALSAYFSFVATSGPWHAMPGFTAHQLIYCERLTCPAAPTPHHAPLRAPHQTRPPSAPHHARPPRRSASSCGWRARVAVPVALYTAYIGCAGWFGSSASTPAERILGEVATGLHLAQLQLAILLFWVRTLTLTLTPALTLTLTLTLTLAPARHPAVLGENPDPNRNPNRDRNRNRNRNRNPKP